MDNNCSERLASSGLLWVDNQQLLNKILYLQPTEAWGFLFIIYTVLQCDLPPLKTTLWGGPGPRFEPETGDLYRGRDSGH